MEIRGKQDRFDGSEYEMCGSRDSTKNTLSGSLPVVEGLQVPVLSSCWRIIDVKSTTGYFEETPPQRKSLYNQCPEFVSESWIPICNMKLLGSTSDFYHGIQSLQDNRCIIGWKRTRNDGNSMYRAVMAKYLELIHKVYSTVSDLQNFCQILSEINVPRDRYECFYRARDGLLQIIRKNVVLKQKPEHFKSIFLDMIGRFQDFEFDRMIVFTGRLLAANTLSQFREMYSEADFNSAMSEIMVMGTESFELGLAYLSMALGVGVHVIKLIGDENRENIYGDKKISISIIMRNFECFITYTIQEMEIEGYNFQNCTYNFFTNPEFYISMQIIQSHRIGTTSEIL